MDTVASADGTTIAFDRYGDGPPVIMAVAAFNTRSATDPLARALAPQFSVLNYDRRGRGDSGDTTPYAGDRGVDDLAALIAAAGGAPPRFGRPPRPPPAPQGPPPRPPLRQPPPGQA